MYITTSSQLQSYCQSIQSAQVIAIDTEFKRETTYYPQLCLIQIASQHSYAIIDALAIDDLSPVNTLLQSPNIVKLIHSSSQDLEIFYQEFNVLPKNIFDSQIAASALGLGNQISFKNLVQYFLNIELDKSETRSDWTMRPLSQQQIDYAKDDVIYLLRCYPHIIQQLTKLNRLKWLQGDFLQLENTSKFSVDTQTLWKKVRGHQNLKNTQLPRLNQLAIWRETIAMEQNLTRRKAIDDHCLITATKATQHTLFQQPCLATWLPHYKQKLQTIIQQNPSCAIKNYQPIILDDQEKQQLTQLTQLVAQRSQQLNIDLERFVSQKKLKTMIKKQAKSSTPYPAFKPKNWLDFAIYQTIDAFFKYSSAP